VVLEPPIVEDINDKQVTVRKYSLNLDLHQACKSMKGFTKKNTKGNTEENSPKHSTELGPPSTEIQNWRAVMGSLTHGYRAINVLVKENLEIEWEDSILL
jgi:hypothetical protein